MEEWKDIVDNENYEISSLGNVRNKEAGRVLRNCMDMDGYYQCCITHNNKRKSKKIHRLIAEAFISNPENKEQVDHIDGNRKNNSIENLRWVTKQENQWNKNSKGYVKTQYGKFHARIYNNGKRIHLGCFETEEEAKQAYLTKFIELRGERFLRK